MAQSYRNKTKGTEEHLQLTEEVLEAKYADIAEQRYLLIGRLQNKEINEQEFAEADRELRLTGMNMLNQHKLAQSQEGFDHLVMSGYFADRKRNAIHAYNTVFAPFAKMLKEADIADSVGSSANAQQKIKGKDILKVWAAAGGTVMSSDAQSEEMYTDLAVHYVEKPITFLNVVQKTTVDVMDIREFREDSSKVSAQGDSVTFRAEAASLTQSDFGTKSVTRELKSVGTFVKYTLETVNDQNRRHFMPYMNARLLQRHELVVEDAALNAAGSGNLATGMLQETGVLTSTAITKGAWTFATMNNVADHIGKVVDAAYRTPTHIIIHPTMFYKWLQVGSADAGWYMQAPVSNLPLGASLPSLFGVPIIVSWALGKQAIVVGNLEETLLYTNGAIIQRDEGLEKDDLTKLMRTIIMYCWMQQFTRFPNWIHSGSQAT